MLEQLVEILKNIALRHKGVKTFKYQAKVYNNAQNNHKTFQVYLDDYSLHQMNITTNIFVSEFQMYILSQPDKKEDSILKVQDDAFQIALDILKYLETHNIGFLKMHDFSIMLVSHYTDDDSAGVRLSIVLEMPSPLNICDYEENFNELPYEDEPDKEIDVPEKEISEELIIKKTKLPTNKC